MGDRAETLVSPELQAERIRSYASARGLSVEMLEPELDVSGGKVERPILGEAIGRIEAGGAQGLIVAQLDRLSRMDIADAIHTIERIEGAGGAVVAVAENFDASTPEGDFARNMFLSMGRMQLRRYSAQFRAAKAQAVARGIWPVPKPPRGYVRGPERKLIPGPDASLVREAFEARAAGEPWSAVADILGSGYSGAGKTIRNRAYLGEIILGDLRNPRAHPPLVSRELWEAAQRTHPKPPRSGHTALLGGILRCETCGGAMSPISRKGWRGYRCYPRKAQRICPAPAMISAHLIEPYVESVCLAYLRRWRWREGQDDGISQARETLAAAEAELIAYQEAVGAAAVGVEHYGRGLRQRVETVEAARGVLGEAFAARPAQSGRVLDLWGELSVKERRHVLRGLGPVWVRRGHARSDRLEDRVRFEFEPPPA